MPSIVCPLTIYRRLIIAASNCYAMLRGDAIVCYIYVIESKHAYASHTRTHTSANSDCECQKSQTTRNGQCVNNSNNNAHEYASHQYHFRIVQMRHRNGPNREI